MRLAKISGVLIIAALLLGFRPGGKTGADTVYQPKLYFNFDESLARELIDKLEESENFDQTGATILSHEDETVILNFNVIDGDLGVIVYPTERAKSYVDIDGYEYIALTSKFIEEDPGKESIDAILNNVKSIIDSFPGSETKLTSDS